MRKEAVFKGQVAPGSNHATYMFELLNKVLLVVVICSAFVQYLGGLLP